MGSRFNSGSKQQRHLTVGGRPGGLASTNPAVDPKTNTLSCLRLLLPEAIPRQDLGFITGKSASLVTGTTIPTG